MKNIIAVLVTLIMSSVVMASEKSLYSFSWLDGDKEIYVLQNRKFRKNGNLYIGATAAYNLSQDFLDAYGGTFRAGYFFTEDWGVEFLYGKNSSTQNDTAKGVKEQGAYPFYREIDSFMGAMIIWSPFYSKINTFNQIFYFDWMFGLGAGNITTKDNRKLFNSTAPQSERNQLTQESNVGAIWNTGFRFYLSENWSLRLDITGTTYQADKTRSDGATKSSAKKIFTNYDLGLGLNYAF
jgi:outer membrane beta-barrel protein